MVDIDFPISININGYYDIRYFSFIPKTTGIYTIESICHTGFPVAYLCSADGTELTQSEGISDVPYENFKFEYTLTAGTIYTIRTRDITNVGTYKIKITPPEYNETEKVVEYTYDDNGNRTKMTTIENDEIINTVYTYDKNDRLLTTQRESESIITYTYDDNGNMLSKSDGITQVFDVLNRIIKFTSSNDITTVYEYYPDDMRKSKKVGTTEKVTQVWLEDEIALDIEGSDTTITYLHGNKLICGTYGWYLYNAHGDVTALVNDSGTVIQNYGYDAFGVQLNDDATDKNPYRYCGEYYDIESGYTYLQARYYDSAIGGFVSEDPALDGSNWYVYCGNDPINMIDPTGMWTKKVHEEITEIAFNDVKVNLKRSGMALGSLLKGCVFPDDNYRGKGNHKWHGHPGYYKILKNQLKVAKQRWGERKYKDAYFEIGKAIHTIQDFYAHRVMQNGENKSWTKVTFGKIKIGTIESLEYSTNSSALLWPRQVIAGDYPEYADFNFLMDCNGVGKKLSLGRTYIY